jgi:hypothetical protein
VTQQDAQTSTSSKSKPGQIGEVIDLVKDYARQETLGPLRGALRWLAYGVAGAIALGFGSILVVLGVLRMIQNEFAPTFAGRWFSLLPYVIAFVLSLLVIVFAASRIAKTSLHPKNDRPG